MPSRTAITYAVDGKPSLKDRQRALREDAILDAAVDLFAERGFASVTLEQIADAACVSKPTLYQHVRSKEDLVLHVTLRCLDQAAEAMSRIPDDLPVGERLDRYLGVIVEFRMDSRVSQYIDLAQRLLPMKHENPELAEKEEGLTATFTALIEEAASVGIVRNDIPPAFLCQVIVSLMKSHTAIASSPGIDETRRLLANLRALLGMPPSSLA